MCAFTRNDTGHLVVDGVSLDTIASQFGSPLYVYSGAGIAAAYNDFAAAVAPVNGKVHYALKANSALGVIALLAKHGAGADIVSGGEMDRAVAAGIDPADIVFSGVGKSRDEICKALAAGVGQINAESSAELEMISAAAAEMGVSAPVALRVNVDVDPGTHAKISTGQRSTKFGISTDQREAADLYKLLHTDPHITPAGLAVHIGSQITTLDPFERAYSALLALGNGLRSEGLPVPNLDLGGGVGVDYESATPTDFSAYGTMLTKIFKNTGFTLGLSLGGQLSPTTACCLQKSSSSKKGTIKDLPL